MSRMKDKDIDRHNAETFCNPMNKILVTPAKRLGELLYGNSKREIQDSELEIQDSKLSRKRCPSCFTRMLVTGSDKKIYFCTRCIEVYIPLKSNR